MELDIVRGDIVLANFEPVRGNEQGGVRPFLILQNDILNKYSSLITGVPLTKTIYEKEYPSNVVLFKKNSNLKFDSTILCSQIKTIDKKRVLNKLTKIDTLTLSKVSIAVKYSLGL